MAPIVKQEMTATSDRLFVTKIPMTVTKEAITAHFARFGATTDVYVPFVPGHVGHKGIAFVSFHEPRSLQLAMAGGPHVISGAEVVVDVAAPREEGGKGASPGKGGKGAVSKSRLFITKVPPMLTKESLTEYFQNFGELQDIYVPSSAPGSDAHKGIAFVSYIDAACCQAALNHAPHEVQGHPIVVDVAAPKGGGKGGKGFEAAGKGAKGKAAYGGYGGFMSPYSGYMMAPMGGKASYGAGAAAKLGKGAGMAGRTGSAGAALPGRLFLTKVPPGVTKEDLEMYFGQFGTLNDVFMPGFGTKGIAFLSYADPAICSQVLLSPQHMVKPGCIVTADQAMDRPASAGGVKGGKGVRSMPY